MRDKEKPFDLQLAEHRADLVAHCYRMVGSLADAEDLAQEALARAWRGRGGFKRESSVRTWLLRIATNACVDELRARPRRRLPTGEERVADPLAPIGPQLDPEHWIGPFADGRYPVCGDAAAAYSAHESIGLAFIAALQHLSPRQRAVLISRDVLGFEAAEVARHLDVTVSAVNSLLHRARARLRDRDITRDDVIDDRALLDRYVSAWTAGDARALVALLREDATFSMPPQPAWFRGRNDIASFLRARVFPGARWRLSPTRANGRPAFLVHCARGRRFEPHAVHVLDTTRRGIASIVCFLDPDLVRRCSPGSAMVSAR